MKDCRIISGSVRACTLLNLKYQHNLLQQQGAEMQQVLPTEFIIRPGYFKYIKIDERPQRQRKLQRQPAPAREIATEMNVNTEYRGHPQNNRGHGEGEKTVCRLVDLFCKP